MGSLAAAAAVVMFSLWATALGSLACAYLGLRTAAAVFGLLSMIGGVWLMRTLPHAPVLWLVNIVAGVVGLLQLRGR